MFNQYLDDTALTYTPTPINLCIIFIVYCSTTYNCYEYKMMINNDEVHNVKNI